MGSLTYQYSPLLDPADELRLLTTQPGSFDDPIVCTLRTVSARDHPFYHALSYAWGDDTARLPIQLNNRTLYVTANLEAALRSIRSTRFDMINDRSLWVDAVCINQENLEERNEQVRRMRDIYKVAFQVIIWLGKFYEPIDDLVQTPPNLWGFDHLEEGTLRNTDAAFQLVGSLSSYTNWADTFPLRWNSTSHEIHHTDPKIWGQLARLYKRSWFNRLWVIQELAVARNAVVVCGTSAIFWTDFEKAANIILNPKLMFDITKHRFHPFMSAENVYSVSLWDADRQNILSILKYTQRAKCADPRDRLYAVLGIVENTGDVSDVEIDYEKPVEEAYMNWSRRRIQRTKTLDIFSACADSGSRGLPSWVPDLRHEWGSDIPLFSRTHGSPTARYNPKYAANPPQVIQHVFLGRELVVPSMHIGFISALSKVGDVTGHLKDPMIIRPGLLNVIHGWESLATSYFPHRRRDWSSGPFVDALLRGYRNWGERTDTALRVHYAVWRNSIEKQDNTDTGTEAEFQRKLPEMDKILFKMTHNCQMFITSDGDFGTIAGNCHAEVGDHIYVVSGGATPFVLRPEGSSYRLMGSCYVGRRMHGETTDEFERGERELSTISIV